MHPPNITCSPQVFPIHMYCINKLVQFSKTPLVSISASITLQPKLSEAVRNCSMPPAAFWFFSFYRFATKGAQLCSVRPTNVHVSLAKNPSSHVLSCTCFSRTSFHLCLLQLNGPSRVCPSKTPSDTTDFPKNP